jgi:hypothetical protein
MSAGGLSSINMYSRCQKYPLAYPGVVIEQFRGDLFSDFDVVFVSIN